MSVQELLDKLRVVSKLMLPSRMLKTFPPDFTLRRPLVSLLDKRIRSGDSCYLALYRWEVPSAHEPLSPDTAARLQAGTRAQLKELTAEQFRPAELIGMDQFGPQEYVMLIRESCEPGEAFVPPALFRKLELLKHSLEVAIEGRMPAERARLSLTGTYVPVCLPLSQQEASSSERLQEAYHFALALATRQVTPQVIAARRQLDQILQDGSISVLAQPIMNLRSGDVFGWEILTRGPAASVFHLPDELFRFASQSKLLSKLEFLVVRHAMEEIAARGIREPIFLNVTPVTLAHPTFLSHMLQCLERHPALSPGQIVLEITERHEVQDLKAMADILDTFRKHGFRFAVDDAGAGYSSLQWIGELTPELIKIDRSVIQFVDRFAVKLSLLRAIVNAASEMSCEVVAEGVEREEEADVLFQLNVGMGQGYYFARPNVLLHEHERDIFQETKRRIQHRRGQVAS
ncbi:EAL domain-containing protein [Cohnella nanjingensis]|uniref:EAL domain-containing protein n=1 Tax=Cohnella nanjingensis TaxID=1387779 RepID=A0A7X0RLJ4_9BACL|nr:EAL domain-containing protein [Cohnella nanjingensis]MBB6669680.1 EAL domain-containing protein [Cohnella nanjingensis]